MNKREFHYAPILTSYNSEDGFVIYYSEPYGDGKKYIKVGEAGNEELAQQMVSILTQIESVAHA